MVQPFRVFATALTSNGLSLVMLGLLVPLAACSTATAQSATADSQPETIQAAELKSTETPATQPSESAAATYQLRYKFQPDQILTYETKQTIIQTGVAPFGKQVETNKIEQRRIYTITNVEDAGNATASMQFEYVRMERNTDKADPIVFDTKMKSEDVPQFFRAAAKSLKTKAPTYELKTTGIEIDDESLEQTLAGGQASFIVPMPESAVAVGETWTTFVEVKVRIAEQMFRTVKLRKTFRLKAIEDGVAEIGMATSTVGSVKDPRVQVQLLQATPAGTVWFDVDRGIVTKKEIRFNNTVLNAMGPKTMVSAKGRTIERLL